MAFLHTDVKATQQTNRLVEEITDNQHTTLKR